MCYQNDVIESFEVGSLTVEILHDRDPMDPRKEFDHVGVLACWHRNYRLGDEQPSCSPDEYLQGLLSQETQDIVERCEAAIDNTPSELGPGYHWIPVLRYRDRYAKLLDIKKRAIEGDLEKNYVILECFLHDHGGIMMSTGAFSCPWDSGPVGLIYCSMETARKEWGGGNASDEEVRERAESYLKGEVSEYSSYLEGSVYGFVIRDDEGEELESVWGFYDMDHCKEEAKSTAEYLASKIPQQLELALSS
jgi:hypothetical protein